MDSGAVAVNNARNQGLPLGVFTLFDFLKRRNTTQVQPPKRATAGSGASRSSPKARQAYDPLSPLPVPEMKEGNEESDWSMWEDSVAFQDSKTNSITPETRPAPLNPAEPIEDPFAKVRLREP
jgi:hypothetical protein